jgi:hypothetical protein
MDVGGVVLDADDVVAESCDEDAKDIGVDGLQQKGEGLEDEDNG